jgi:hypothetical protein
MAKRTKEGALCGRAFGKLSSAERRHIPPALFGLPSERKYPMPDSSHAKNAKGRARQQLNQGNLSTADYFRVVKKANKILSQCLVAPKRRKKAEVEVLDQELAAARAVAGGRRRKVA